MSITRKIMSITRKQERQDARDLQYRESARAAAMRGCALACCCRCFKTIKPPENSYFVVPWHQTRSNLDIGCASCYEETKAGAVDRCLCCSPIATQ
jgi:hypothetical protein